MKAKHILLTAILIATFLSSNAYAIFLLDREETLNVPGGKKQDVLVNNITGKVTMYKNNGIWNDNNESYLKQLQRLYELQSKHKNRKPGYYDE
ncbi:MAG TPA: hypothetical protein PKY78_03065 [Candidatus Omnitrophota bacterium]|nr:hypothetical protein [Candidatus Omnitrophota bacterium]HPS19954.1 hypothetical protein [Candidatus Omnitrophota bacterium]